EFMQRIEGFLRAVPRIFPIGIECRNKNYLNEEYFKMLKANDATHVFSEKQYMPPVAELASSYEAFLGDRIAFRLLGGDRKEIEEKTGERWDRIVDAKDERPIVLVLRHLLSIGKRITLNVNNHYEGSAPLTIQKILDGIAREGVGP
ncbi:MAG: DUF72 domain-containing protein, partial [Bacillota bacterium]|nr:DUF72 domain-containing protein [Bacillota bacterium]